MLLSGSSEANLAVASALGVERLSYPSPTHATGQAPAPTGLRIGLLARSARPRRGRSPVCGSPRTAPGNASSGSRRGRGPPRGTPPGALRGSGSCSGTDLWLDPFRHYQSFCPYLVGDVEQVSRSLAWWLDRYSTSTLILDHPRDPEDYETAAEVISRADTLRRRSP